MKVTVTTGSPDYHTNPDCHHLDKAKSTRKVELNKIPHHSECNTCSDEPRNKGDYGSFLDQKVRCWICSETYHSMDELKECVDSHDP